MLPAPQATLFGGRRQGFGGSGAAVIEYSIAPGVTLGAEAGADSFGAYRETHAAIRLRARFDGPR
jgi:hypothetical protein